jgi:hypothetical protein
VVSVNGAGQAPESGGTMLTAAMVQQVAAASRSATAGSGRAEVIFHITLGGAVQGYGTDDVRFDGKNWNSAYTQTSPIDTNYKNESVVTRVAGHRYFSTVMLHGRPTWILFRSPMGTRKLDFPDARKELGMLAPAARFQVAGHQTIGGVRLTVLRATDPARVKNLSSLPDVHTVGEKVAALTVWVDEHHVVYRMAVTFRGSLNISTHHPVSQAAVRAVHRDTRAWEKIVRRFKQTGKWPPASVMRPVEDRLTYAQLHEFKLRRETDVTRFTITFSDLGQPQHISAPKHWLPESVLRHT